MNSAQIHNRTGRKLPARRYGGWILPALIFVLIFAGSPEASTYDVSVKAGDIWGFISATGDFPTADSRYGILGIDIKPSGITGGYTISDPSTSLGTWSGYIPDWVVPGAAPYGPNNHAYFLWKGPVLTTSAEMITNKPLSDFPAVYAWTWPNIALLKAPDTASFNFRVTTNDPSETWDGRYQFIVQGVKYSLSEAGSIGDGVSVPDPFGFSQPGSSLYDLAHNNGEGYGGQVPVPSAMLLFGSGIATMVGWRRFFRR